MMVKRTIFLILLLGSAAYSQPYYYYFKYNSTYNVPGYSGDIFRLNLMTNNNELFVQNAGRVVGPVFYNSGQSEIFFQVRFSLVVIDVSDPSRREKEILSGINEIHGVKDSPEANRYFITFDDEQDSTKTVIMDRVTLQPTDTIYEEDTPYNSFLSSDQNGLYRLQDDSTGIFFSEYFIDRRQQGNPMRCGNLGPFAGSPSQEDAHHGYALVGYDDSLEMNLVKQDFAASFLYQYYVLCNVDQNITYTPIQFPWRSNGYLSSDGKYAIIEQVNYDTTQVGDEYHTGIVYVFDASTGELTQRLSLPPDGKILVFDNYPQTFYYYNDSTNQSVTVSDTAVTPTGALIDTLISLKHQAVANGWLTNGPQHEKDEDDDRADEGIVERLDRRLDKAEDALTKSDSAKARLELELFVKEVEQLYHKDREEGERRGVPVLTSEGYALLKYNAEYLIERLPERHERRDNEKGNIER